jgi:hypothetical protein
MLPSSNECVICLDTGGDDDTYAVCRLTLHLVYSTLHLHATYCLLSGSVRVATVPI